MIGGYLMETDFPRHTFGRRCALAGIIMIAAGASFAARPAVAQRESTSSASASGRGAVQNPLRRPADAPTAQRSEIPAGDLVRKAYAVARAGRQPHDYSQVITLCQQARGASGDEIIQDYTARLLSWAHNRRGEARAREGHEQEALADFEAAIRYDSTRWRAVHNRGVSLAMAGQYERAITDFSHTITLRPRYANAYFNRGEMHYQMEDFEASIEDYSQAIQLDGQDIAAWNGRGHARFRLGRFEPALEDFNRALQLDPRHAAALANRADVHYELGRFAEAVRDLRAALDIDGQLGHAHLSLAWILSTCPDESLRDPVAAVRAAEKAIELDGDSDHRYLDALAAAHASAGNFGKAQEVVRRAIERAPPDEAARYAARLALYEDYRPLRPSTSAERDGRTARQASHELPASGGQHINAQQQIGQRMGQHTIPDAARPHHQPRHQ